MKLTVLGSGVAVPNDRRAPSCYLLQSEGTDLLLDAGAAVMLRLEEAGYDFRDLDGVLLSHFHPDHTAGLVPLLFAFHLPDLGRTRPLPLWGSPGLTGLLSDLGRAWGDWLTPIDFDLEVREIREHAFAQGAFRIQAGMGTHCSSSLFYRITDPHGKSLVYSGDTPPSDALTRLAQDADLLILECSLPSHMNAEGHLNASQAGRLAREAGVKRLLLTHFYPPCEEVDVVQEAGAEFDGEVIKGEDLMVVEV